MIKNLFGSTVTPLLRMLIELFRQHTVWLTRIVFALTMYIPAVMPAQDIDTLAQYGSMKIVDRRIVEVGSGSYMLLADHAMLLTNDAFDTYHEVLDPTTFALSLDGPGVYTDFNSGTVYIVTSEINNPAQWRVYWSLDHGQSFPLLASSKIDDLPDVVPESGGSPWWARPQWAGIGTDSCLQVFDAYFNPKDGLWRAYQSSLCIPTSDRATYDNAFSVAAGNGVYHALDMKNGSWKKIDVINQTCTESNVPSEASRLFVTKDYSLFATDVNTKSSRIWGLDKVAGTFQLLDTLVTDRDTIAVDQLKLRIISTDNFRLLTDEAKGRILYFDTNTIRELNLASWRKCIETEPDGVYLSAISGSDSTILLFLYSQSCGNNLALFSLVTGEMIEDFAYTPNYAMNYQYMNLTPKGVVKTETGVTFVRTDLQTGVRKRVGRYNGSDSSLRRPMAFCEGTYLSDTLCVVDQYGLVNQVQSTDSCVLPAFTYNVGTQNTFGTNSPFPYTIGLPRIVPLKGAVATLGLSFKVLFNRAVFTESRRDTVTAALQRSDGSWLLGYHSLFSTTDSARTRILVPSPADSVSCISGILETSNGGLLLSRRGHNLLGRGPEPVDVVGGLWLQPKPEAPWQQVGTDLVETEGIGPMVLSLTRNPLDSSIWASNCWVSAVAQFNGTPNGDSSFYYSGSIYDYRLHRSTDGGMSWQLMARVDDNWNYAPTTGSVSFSSTGEIAWTLHDRIMISSDGGMQWQSTQDQGTLGLPICSAMFDKQDNLVIASRNGLFSVPANTVSVHEEHAPSEETPLVHVSTQPNPTNGSFTVRLYNLDHLQGAMQRLHIVDVAGRVIADITSLVAGNYSSGRVDVPVALGRIPSGVYMLIGTDGHHTFTHPFVVVME